MLDSRSRDDAAPTLDELFRRAAVQRPYATALCDPPNRAAITGTPPRRLTYLEVDNAVSGVAARLRGLGLPTDAVVAFQLPHVVESVVMLLGVLRAGMIAAPLPMLWRGEEIVAALAAGCATAIVTSARIGDTDHAAIAMQAAADHFPIRHVGAFGTDGLDGITAFDDIFTSAAPSVSVPREGDAAAHAAVITFESTLEGPRALARDHRQVLAGARVLAGAAALRGDAPARGAILSAVPLSSFAGLALALVPWLTAGTQLVLHHPFDADALAAQGRDHHCGLAVLPGPAVAPLAAAGIVDPATCGIAALWRSAAQARIAAKQSAVRRHDIIAYGEYALAPLQSADAAPEMARSAAGTLLLRGAMVPQPWPARAARADGFLDTGYPCAEGDLAAALPPAGLTCVGGYRLPLAAIARRLAVLDPSVTVAALPNALTGSRLAGTAADPAAMAQALARVHPLLADAFLPRPTAA